jgi:hypothetical protein
LYRKLLNPKFVARLYTVFDYLKSYINIILKKYYGLNYCPTNLNKAKKKCPFFNYYFKKHGMFDVLGPGFLTPSGGPDPQKKNSYKMGGKRNMIRGHGPKH